MTPFLQGENPLDIDRLCEHLVQKMSGEGSVGGITVTAIAGIEVALHDLAGKILEVPAYQLLGGKYRDEVRVYCDCHTEEEADPVACADEAERVVSELGYDAPVRLRRPSGHEKDRANRHLRQPEIEHKASIVEAVTERVGSRADVAFDCHWTFSAGSAKRLAERLEEYDIWWLEDPVPPENHDVQREVTQSTTTPITAGENVYRKHGQRRLIEEQAVDIIAPDMPKVGGMRETRKIADLADLYYMPVAMHNVLAGRDDRERPRRRGDSELAGRRVPLLRTRLVGGPGRGRRHRGRLHRGPRGRDSASPSTWMPLPSAWSTAKNCSTKPNFAARLAFCGCRLDCEASRPAGRRRVSSVYPGTRTPNNILVVYEYITNLSSDRESTVTDRRRDSSEPLEREDRTKRGRTGRERTDGGKSTDGAFESGDGSHHPGPPRFVTVGDGIVNPNGNEMEPRDDLAPWNPDAEGSTPGASPTRRPTRARRRRTGRSPSSNPTFRARTPWNSRHPTASTN